VGYALVILAAACWATGGVVARWLFGGSRLEMTPPELSAARAVLAAAALLAFLLAGRRDTLRIRSRDLFFLIAFGVAGQALLHLAYYEAIAYAGVATAILLEYLAPLLVLVISVVFLGERPTWTLPTGVALAVGGVALVVGLDGGALRIPWQGLAWGLTAAGLFATYMLMGRFGRDRFDPWTLLCYGLLVAAAFWVVVQGPGDILRTLSDPARLAAVGYVAVVSTVVPFGVFLVALRHLDPTRAGVTATIEPVLAGVVAWIALGEALGLMQIVGAVFVLAAIVVVQIPTPVAEDLPPPT
jgi:drug/metabolite transporter (DMT)-like permease